MMSRPSRLTLEMAEGLYSKPVGDIPFLRHSLRRYSESIYIGEAAATRCEAAVAAARAADSTIDQNGYELPNKVASDKEDI